ncbi:MAG: hypothetical protein IT226_06315 [Flavobacteriales bacterium]|nr:hypothetical protein [Flavobacteriales bacterium]
MYRTAGISSALFGALASRELVMPLSENAPGRIHSPAEYWTGPTRPHPGT